MEGARERAPKEPKQPSNRGHHYFAALREAGTLVLVFVSIDGLFYKSMEEIHWLELGLWILFGLAMLLWGPSRPPGDTPMNMIAGALPLVALGLLAYIDGVVLPRREARRAREAAEKRRLAAQSAGQDAPAQGQSTVAR